MHETNNYKALQQGFEAGAKWGIAQQNKYNEQNKYCKVDFLIIKIKENSIKKKKLSEGIRTLIYGSLKRGKNNFKKTNKTEQILGCTIEEFKIYIQSNFKKGMSFENRNKWHLDHIIPISTAISYDDVIRLNHYTNFQPLWAKENLSKGDKIIDQQLKLL
jgi:hypothetical protein